MCFVLELRAVTSNLAVEWNVANGSKVIIKEVVPHPEDHQGCEKFNTMRSSNCRVPQSLSLSSLYLFQEILSRNTTITHITAHGFLFLLSGNASKSLESSVYWA